VSAPGRIAPMHTQSREMAESLEETMGGGDVDPCTIFYARVKKCAPIQSHAFSTIAAAKVFKQLQQQRTVQYP